VQKPKRRDRYIAFEFGDPRRAREVSAAFHAALASWPREDRPSLVFIERSRGLARCGHLHKDDVIRLLNGLRIGDPPVPVRTVGTSGTIRAARSRYFSRR
jgi:RNase P/RNase MRP subunit POP5